jgi:multidrug efflux pump subunit AcrA (membrane-fusion protein)
MQPFHRSARCRWVVLGLLASLAAPGCKKSRTEAPSVSAPPVVQVVQPARRDVVRVVSQPSFVETYERTSIYPKVTGYIEKWVVDIGDRVKKGQTLATLFVPELREDWETKKRTVKLDKDRVALADAAVAVAEAEVETAEAGLQEARDLLAKYKADTERWDVEAKRLQREVDRGW